LFGPAALSPEKLATTIAKLVSMLGEDRVGTPMTVDSHLPDRYALGDFQPPPPPDLRRTPRRSTGLLAVRVFRPPVPVEVITRPSRSDEPGDVQIESLSGEISGEVRHCAGPWKIADEWWAKTPAANAYWDVELSTGSYRVYRDEVGEGWFVDVAYG
jgi:protein ImuB